MYSKWDAGKKANTDTGAVDPPLSSLLPLAHQNNVNHNISNIASPPATSTNPRALQHLRYNRQRYHDYPTLGHDLLCQTRYISRTMLNAVNPIITLPTTSLTAELSSQNTLLPSPSSAITTAPDNEPCSHSNHTHLYSLHDNLPPPSYTDLINNHPLAQVLVEDVDRAHLEEYQRVYKLHQDYQQELFTRASHSDPSPDSPTPPPDLPDHRIRFNHSKLPAPFLNQTILPGLTLTPSVEEWANTNHYLKEITQKYAYDHGIIRIIPPRGYQPVFSLDPDTTIFPTRTQAIGRFGTKGGQTIPGREWTVSTYYHATQLFGAEIERFVQKSHYFSAEHQLVVEPPVLFKGHTIQDPLNPTRTHFAPLSTIAATSSLPLRFPHADNTLGDLPELSFQSLPSPFPQALKMLKDALLMANLPLQNNLTASNIAQERVYLYNMHREHDAMMFRSFNRTPVDIYTSALPFDPRAAHLASPTSIDSPSLKPALPAWLTLTHFPSTKTRHYYHMIDKLRRVHDVTTGNALDTQLAQFWTQIIDARQAKEENVLQQRLEAMVDRKLQGGGLADELLSSTSTQLSTPSSSSTTTSTTRSTRKPVLSPLNTTSPLQLLTSASMDDIDTTHSLDTDLTLLHDAINSTRHAPVHPNIGFGSTSLGKYIVEPTSHTNSLLHTVPVSLDNVPTERSPHSTIQTYSWVKYYSRRIVLLGMLFGLQQDTLATLPPVDYIPIMLEYLNADRESAQDNTDNRAYTSSNPTQQRLLTNLTSLHSQATFNRNYNDFDWGNIQSKIMRFLRIKVGRKTAQAVKRYNDWTTSIDKKRKSAVPSFAAIDLTLDSDDESHHVVKRPPRATTLSSQQPTPPPQTPPTTTTTTTTTDTTTSTTTRTTRSTRSTTATPTTPATTTSIAKTSSKQSKLPKTPPLRSTPKKLGKPSKYGQQQTLDDFILDQSQLSQQQSQAAPAPSEPATTTTTTTMTTTTNPSTTTQSSTPQTTAVQTKPPQPIKPAPVQPEVGIQSLSKNPQTTLTVAITYQQSQPSSLHQLPASALPNSPSQSTRVTKYLQPSRFYGHIFHFESISNIRTIASKSSQQFVLSQFTHLLTYILQVYLQPSLNSPSLHNPSNLSLSSVTNRITGVLLKNALLSPLPFPFPHLTPPRFHATSEHVKIAQLERIWSSAITFGYPHIVVEYGKDLPTFHVSAHPHPFSSREQETNPYHDDGNVMSWDDQMVHGILGHNAPIVHASQSNSGARSASIHTPNNQPFPLMTPPSSSSSSATILSESWNPHTIAFLPGSLVAPIGIINGITKPWLYLGTYFSSFPWHIEDDYLYSMSTNLTNAPKVWFGIPSSHADFFEELFSRFTQLGFASLHTLSNILTPQLLLAFGIRCTRLVQEPGHIILTTPRGYHSGFSAGFSCAEAVNLAVSPWLSFGRFASMKYRLETNRESVFSIELLVIRACLIEPALHLDPTGNGNNSSNTLARTLDEIIKDIKEIFCSYFPEFLHSYDLYLRNYTRTRIDHGDGLADYEPGFTNQHEEPQLGSFLELPNQFARGRRVYSAFVEDPTDHQHAVRVSQYDASQTPDLLKQQLKKQQKAHYRREYGTDPSDDESSDDEILQSIEYQLAPGSDLPSRPQLAAPQTSESIALYHPIQVPAPLIPGPNGDMYRPHHHLIGECFAADPATLIVQSDGSNDDPVTIDLSTQPHHCLQLSAQHQPIFIPHQHQYLDPPPSASSTSSKRGPKGSVAAQQNTPPAVIFHPVGLVEPTPTTKPYKDFILDMYLELMVTYKDEFIFQYLEWIYLNNPHMKSPFEQQGYIHPNLMDTFYQNSTFVDLLLDHSSSGNPAAGQIPQPAVKSRAGRKPKHEKVFKVPRPKEDSLYLTPRHGTPAFKFSDHPLSAQACDELRSKLALHLAMSAAQFDLYPELLLQPQDPQFTQVNEEGEQASPFVTRFVIPTDPLPPLTSLQWFTQDDLSRIDPSLFPSATLLPASVLLHNINSVAMSHAFMYITYAGAVDYYYLTYHPDVYDAVTTLPYDPEDNSQFLTVPDSFTQCRASSNQHLNPKVKTAQQLARFNNILLNSFPPRNQIHLHTVSEKFYSTCYTPPVRIRLLDYDPVFQYLSSITQDRQSHHHHHQSLLKLLPQDNDIWIPECAICHQFCWNGFVLCSTQLANHSANFTHTFIDPTSGAPSPSAQSSAPPAPVTLETFLDVWSINPHVYRRELAELQVFCPYHAKADTVCKCTVDTTTTVITTNSYDEPVDLNTMLTEGSVTMSTEESSDSSSHLSEITSYITHNTKYSSCQDKYFLYRFDLGELESIQNFAFGQPGM